MSGKEEVPRVSGDDQHLVVAYLVGIYIKPYSITRHEKLSESSSVAVDIVSRRRASSDIRIGVKLATVWPSMLHMSEYLISNLFSYLEA